MRYNYTFPGLSFNLYNFRDKKNNITVYCSYLLARTQSMFKYTGLPSTIPQRMLELYLQTNGNVCITSVNSELRAFVGGLGGEPDIYYMPTRYIVANPALDRSLNLTIGEDCIVIPSDSAYLGLKPMFERYASAMLENDLSLWIADINARIASFISASDDRTKKSAEAVLSDLIEGKLGVIAENAFLEGIKTQPYGSTGTQGITDLIEYQQYLKASLFNELGLQANYNMKRESINSNEAQLNEDALLPLIDDMLKCRRLGVEAVNDLYGTDISVDFDSSWLNNEKEIYYTLEVEKNAADGSESDSDVDDSDPDSDNPIEEVIKDDEQDED